ncbi:3-ketosteroid dehydrogenase [Patellaria atrata CBS 101060]|uniref:3-ketosteroid dehydrogenase n=1 Tax=Patellaria atrata CBS 101060 TaxID=1346257 RepID=A0A9P4S5W3_9PEZI|nr:3-ketosteroid dehydrogenase [Patellaria atrata CBS 101060]
MGFLNSYILQHRTRATQEFLRPSRDHFAHPLSTNTSLLAHNVVKTDILIIGSGAAALTAAIKAKSSGLSPLIVEKSSLIGGTSSYSGGGLWIPNSGIHPDANDSISEALKYMEVTVGNESRAATTARKETFLKEGSDMVKFLQNYYPNKPGGKDNGRSIEGQVFDLSKLGRWQKKMRMSPRVPNLPFYTFEGPKLFRAKSSLDGFLTAARVVRWRFWRNRLLGRAPVTMGMSLVGQLLLMNVKKKVPIWTNSPMKELIEKDGIVTGAIIEKGGKSIAIEAAQGVILAAGGFAKNEEMRKQHQKQEGAVSHSLAAPEDKGDAILAAVKIGTATELMDEGWWGPTFIDPRTKRVYWAQFERGLPHAMVVDKSGNRFANEAQSYTAFVNDQFKRNRRISSIPAFLILDSNHRNQYICAGMMPGATSQALLDNGLIVKEDTLLGLAQKLGIDDDALHATVDRFNTMVAKGVDGDFHRGSSSYDRFFGDPKYSGNPNLGTIEKSPFYALKIYPGDLGTKGGVLTDEFARALREDGSVIQGLYAVGNSSAAIMGREYIGAGSTLGPALTFAYIAAKHIASVQWRLN